MSESQVDSEGTSEPESAASKLFDLRVLIGTLFTFYGLVLIAAGVFVTTAELRKASDVNINLWMGLGMLAVGLVFLAWWRLKPMLPRSQPDT
jgi:hypothetical protein